MSFFSGFNEEKKYFVNGKVLERSYHIQTYETSFSEAIGTCSNIFIAALNLISIFASYFGSNKKEAVLSFIFFILSIAALVLYYIKKNEIIKVFEENADKTLNIIYFSTSIGIGFIFILTRVLYLL
jgi:hypothetical protein